MKPLVAFLCFLAVVTTPCSGEIVIFRLDDVQDFYHAQQAAEIIDLFIDKNAPLSIAVIGGAFFGNDPAIVSKVTQARNQGSEVVNHGDDASTFFNAVTTDQAKVHISNGEYAPFKPYNSFVPHQNRWAPSTLEALQELNYGVLSTAIFSAFAQEVNLESSPRLLPQATQTANYESGRWVSTIDAVVPDCTSQIASKGVCVVMMHPHEIAEGSVTIPEISTLLDEIKAKGWAIQTFRSFAGNTAPLPGQTPTSPSSPTAPQPTAQQPTAPGVCTSSTGYYLSAVDSCAGYVRCNGNAAVGNPIACAAGTQFNNARQYCDWPRNFECEDSDTPPPSSMPPPAQAPTGQTPTVSSTPSSPTSTSELCTSTGYYLAAVDSCAGYVRCNGQTVMGNPIFCPAGTQFNTARQYCDWPRNFECEG